MFKFCQGFVTALLALFALVYGFDCALGDGPQMQGYIGAAIPFAIGIAAFFIGATLRIR